MLEQTAQLRYARITPRKARLVGDTIKGLPAAEAEAQLLFSSKRAASIILKVLRSAIADAAANQKLMADKLFVKNVLIDQGPMLKRSLPRARGSASPIQKKMSHIKVILAYDESLRAPRFTVQKKEEKQKEKKEKKSRAPKLDRKEGTGEKKEDKRSPFYRRIFNRKVV